MSTRTRAIQRWETVAVTALPPGWRNVFAYDGERVVTACPAVLVQELREVTSYEDVKGPDAIFTPTVRFRDVKEAPFETRAVFADYDGGELAAAVDLGKYRRTLAPDEDGPTPAADEAQPAGTTS